MKRQEPQHDYAEIRSARMAVALCVATVLFAMSLPRELMAGQAKPKPATSATSKTSLLKGMPKKGVRKGKGLIAKEADEEKEPETLTELKAYQAFRYITGGRDPFTFRVKAESGDGGDGTPGAADVHTGVQSLPTGAPKEVKIKMLLEALVKVEALMLSHDYPASMKVTEDARKRVATSWGGANVIDPDPEVNRLYRKVLAYERTAKRLQQAKEIQKEFNALQLEIKGLRWTPGGSAAAVNDSIYEPGGVIRLKGAGAPVQIETIEEDAVVFIYKGQRFRKQVGVDPAAESGQ